MICLYDSARVQCDGESLWPSLARVCIFGNSPLCWPEFRWVISSASQLDLPNNSWR